MSHGYEQSDEVPQAAPAVQKISDRVQHLLAQATPENVRFIKLGPKSKWWPLAHDTGNRLRGADRTFILARRVRPISDSRRRLQKRPR